MRTIIIATTLLLSFPTVSKADSLWDEIKTLNVKGMESRGPATERPRSHFPEREMRDYNNIEIDNCTTGASQTCRVGKGYPMRISSEEKFKLAIAIAYRKTKLGYLSTQVNAFGLSFEREVQRLIEFYNRDCTSSKCQKFAKNFEGLQANILTQLQGDDPSGCKSENYPPSGFINQREYDCYAQRVNQVGQSVERRLRNLEMRKTLGQDGKCLWTRNDQGVFSWEQGSTENECRGESFCLSYEMGMEQEAQSNFYEVRCPKVNNQCPRVHECMGNSASLDNADHGDGNTHRQRGAVDVTQ